MTSRDSKRDLGELEWSSPGVTHIQIRTRIGRLPYRNVFVADYMKFIEIII